MDQSASPGSPSRTLRTQCCVVGGGPAGMMLGYLLGRAGVETLVLEKHADFFRDFRGDTVHPSTMKVMDELGLLSDFLQVPHQKVDQMEGLFGDTPVHLADLTRLDTPCPFIAFMPQWDFLDFLETKGRQFKALQVLKKTEAVDLLRANGRVHGVVAHDEQGTLQISADLTVACDGRHSTLRKRAGLAVENIGAPIDVMWFKVGKDKTASDGIFARIQSGQMMVTIDRGDYWQCAYVIAKGRIDEVKSAGLDVFRSKVAALAPILKDHVGDIANWDDVKLLTVAVDRLKQWALPGLLCIGDAAHAMSPVGGVGINLAVQDAVATANLLSQRFGDGGPTPADLDQVQKRRMFPVRMTQMVQVFIQNNVIDRALSSDNLKPPLMLRLLDRTPMLQGLLAHAIAIGVRPEHVGSPRA